MDEKYYNEPCSTASGKVEVPNMFSEFINRLDKEKAELHSLADRIESKLHRFKNTNFPPDGNDSRKDSTPTRGNDDLEYQLFDSLDSLARIKSKLADSLNKLEQII